MTRKFCDKCGVEFVAVAGHEQWQLMATRVSYNHRKLQEEYFDLCPPCFHLFKMWLKNRPLLQGRMNDYNQG